jgi:hypothetical protein
VCIVVQAESIGVAELKGRFQQYMMMLEEHEEVCVAANLTILLQI